MSQQQRYRVIEKLASGGMAEVFRAESAGIEGFKKKVAIKRVLPHLCKKQKFISMFLDEARLSAHLSHSNVVQVFDIGMGDNTYFIVMEFVDGADLKAISENRRKQRQDFPLEEAVYIATKTCEGLSYAHELSDQDGRPFGIVHRDMSPPNVLITKFGEVKIADFGLAKANNQLEKSEPGIIKGKFSYLSPEAAMGQEVDERTDVFAVGIILWEILASRKLFQGESDYQTVQLVQQAKIPPLSSINPKVPPELDRVIRRALARDPDERYRHARDLSTDLTAFLFHHGKPVGPYDIAALVKETMRAKQRDKLAGPSIIDKLIQEALFEFTSLRSSEDRLARATTDEARPDPFTPNRFGSVHDWASEIAIKLPYDDQRAVPHHGALPGALPAQIFEEGNLAALEDAPSHVPAAPSSQSNAQPVQPTNVVTGVSGVRERIPHSESQPEAPTQGPDQEGHRAKRGAGTVLFVIALLVAAAGALGAWYKNIIPH